MITLKINNVLGYTGTVQVEADKNGTPLEKFWRDRIKDAKHDNCVEVVKKPKAPKPKPKKQEDKD